MPIRVGSLIITAFLVLGERYISNPNTRNPHEKLGRLVISASPWPILFYGVVVRKSWLLFSCNFELSMKFKKELTIISHCACSATVCVLHIIISAPSTRHRTTKLINSWAGRRIALLARIWKLAQNHLALDNCKTLLRSRVICSTHRVADGCTEGRKIMDPHTPSF